MKVLTGMLAAVLLVSGAGASQALVRISDDRGGRIGTYVDKYQGLRTSGERVMIDGLCASACTIVLGAVSRDRICVTARASLGFHAAYDYGANGRPVTNGEATQMLYSMYPVSVRKWIAQRGGLTPRMLFLHGRQLAGMYRTCFTGVQEATQEDPAQVGISDDVSAKAALPSRLAPKAHGPKVFGPMVLAPDLVPKAPAPAF